MVSDQINEISYIVHYSARFLLAKTFSGFFCFNYYDTIYSTTYQYFHSFYTSITRIALATLWYYY